MDSESGALIQAVLRRKGASAPFLTCGGCDDWVVRVARVVGWLLDFGRTMKKLIACLCLLVPLSSWAVAPVIGYYLINTTKGFRSTMQLACTDFTPMWAGSQYHGVFVAPDRCNRVDANNTVVTYEIIGKQNNAACPNGGTPDTTKPIDQQCAAATPTCQAGLVREVLLSAGTRLADGRTTDMLFPTNVQGCQTSMVELVGCFASTASPAIGDAIKCRFRFIQTGVSLGTVESGSQPASDDTPKQLATVPPFNPAQGQGCPAGTVSMGTDSAGQSICGGSGSTPAPKVDPATTVKPTATTNNADGSTTKVDVTERMNSDGSKTTTTKTTVTQADGTQSVSSAVTTGATPGGLTGKPDTTKDEQEKDLCKLHPELNVCRNSTVSGSCGNIACNGDAIQCAILRQQSKEYCENTTDNAASLLGKSIASGSDPMQGQINSAVTGTTVDLSSQSLDQGGFVSGGACLANRTITLVGKPITVSFTSVCDNILPLRAAVISCALIVAYLLVSKSVLQG